MAITTTKARLNLSIDSELKQEVGEVLNEIGLDYTAAINLLVQIGVKVWKM